MEFSIKSTLPEKEEGDALVVGVFEPARLALAAAALDKASKGYISAIIQSSQMSGKKGETRVLYRVPGLKCGRVLLLGLGRKKDFQGAKYAELIHLAILALGKTGAADCVFFMSDFAVPGQKDAAWAVRQAVVAAGQAVYSFRHYKSEKEEKPPTLLKMAFSVKASEQESAKSAILQGEAILKGILLTRDLGNQPANICTPDYLAHAAQSLAKESGLNCEVLSRKDMENLGMNALLAVARGSRQPPRFIILRHQGAKTKPIVLIGKGITFDSGGISLKPAASMDEMKYDMCGAAAVLGVMAAVSGMGLPVNLLALIPTCENMPGGQATRPGDIVTSLSGKTIEILNTDAEGRLILCDALHYAKRFDPETIIDVATLTGACVVALGHVATGLFSNDDVLAKALREAGEETGDKVWRLPLWEEYQDLLKSAFADMSNTGGRDGGAVSAACFLSRFVEKTAWAHLDIAGTAWKSGGNSSTGKGATGRPVYLLTQFLMERAKEKGGKEVKTKGAKGQPIKGKSEK